MRDHSWMACMHRIIIYIIRIIGSAWDQTHIHGTCKQVTNWDMLKLRCSGIGVGDSVRCREQGVGEFGDVWISCLTHCTDNH